MEIIIIAVVAIIISAIYIHYHRKFGRTVKSIVSGMSYSEVIDLLGEPDISKSADGFTTCIWRGFFRRYRSTYCTITFQEDTVVSIVHRW